MGILGQAPRVPREPQKRPLALPHGQGLAPAAHAGLCPPPRPAGGKPSARPLPFRAAGERRVAEAGQMLVVVLLGIVLGIVGQMLRVVVGLRRAIERSRRRDFSSSRPWWVRARGASSP